MKNPKPPITLWAIRDAPCRLHSRTGFTLLEILVAIAILALVVTSLYGAYSGTLETTEKVESVRDVDQAARLALMQMADDFKSLYYTKSQGNDGPSPYRLGGGEVAEGEEGSLVEFASTNHLGFDMIFPSQLINRVIYVLEKDPDNERYHRLIRKELPFADLPGQQQEVTVEIADGIKKLTLTYFNEDGQVFTQWDSSAMETEGLLPRIVHIQLQLAEDESRTFEIKVAIRVQGAGDSGQGEAESRQ